MKASDLTRQKTCGSHPEQYDVFYHGVRIGYLHYRWGVFEIGLYLLDCTTVISSNILGGEYEGQLPSEKRAAILKDAREQIVNYYPSYHAGLLENSSMVEGNEAPYGLRHVRRLAHSPWVNQRFLFVGSSLLKGDFSGGLSLPDYVDKAFGSHSEKLIIEGGDVFDSHEDDVLEKATAYPLAGPIAGVFVEVSPFGVFSERVLRRQESFEKTLQAVSKIFAERYHCPLYFYILPYPLTEDYLLSVLSLRSFKKKWKLKLIDFFHSAKLGDEPSRRKRLYFPDGAHPTKAALKEFFLPKFLKLK